MREFHVGAVSKDGRLGSSGYLGQGLVLFEEHYGRGIWEINETEKVGWSPGCRAQDFSGAEWGFRCEVRNHEGFPAQGMVPCLRWTNFLVI